MVANAGKGSFWMTATANPFAERRGFLVQYPALFYATASRATSVGAKFKFFFRWWSLHEDAG